MIKIGFCGAPGSGKTTVAQAVAAKLRFKSNKKVELIDEYARYFVSKFGETSIYDQYHIAISQIEKEKENSDYLITDSPIILSTVFLFMNMNWKDKKELFYFKKTYSLIVEYFHSYDFLFYFKPLEAKDDGKRIHKDEKTIEKIDAYLKSLFLIHDVKYFEIEGDLETRVDNCLTICGIKNAGSVF